MWFEKQERAKGFEDFDFTDWREHRLNIWLNILNYEV